MSLPPVIPIIHCNIITVSTESLSVTEQFVLRPVQPLNPSHSDESIIIVLIKHAHVITIMHVKKSPAKIDPDTTRHTFLGLIELVDPVDTCEFIAVLGIFSCRR